MKKNKVLSKKEKEEIKHLLDDGEIGLWLDTYDFIFSDFDHRHFSQRAISQDFLEEAKRATKEIKPGRFGFKLLLPDHLRRKEQESVIKKRLHQHFHKHAQLLETEMRKMTLRSIGLCLLGFMMMTASALIVHYLQSTFYFSFLRTILEPAGWFMVWFGFDNLFYKRREESSEHDFYQKMSKAEIDFESY